MRLIDDNAKFRGQSNLYSIELSLIADRVQIGNFIIHKSNLCFFWKTNFLEYLLAANEIVFNLIFNFSNILT